MKRKDAVPRSVPRAAALGRLTAVVVVVHFVVAGMHGVAHIGAGVALTAAQLVVVVVVISVAPFYGLDLHYRRPGRRGPAILVASMAASLVFGWFFHFVADTPDNVTRVEPGVVGDWATAFDSSAYIVAGIELLGTLLAVALLLRVLSLGGRAAAASDADRAAVAVDRSELARPAFAQPELHDDPQSQCAERPGREPPEGHSAEQRHG
jgi:hypothetical protein